MARLFIYNNPSSHETPSSQEGATQIKERTAVIQQCTNKIQAHASDVEEALKCKIRGAEGQAEILEGSKNVPEDQSAAQKPARAPALTEKESDQEASTKLENTYYEEMNNVSVIGRQILLKHPEIQAKLSSKDPTLNKEAIEELNTLIGNDPRAQSAFDRWGEAWKRAGEKVVNYTVARYERMERQIEDIDPENPLDYFKLNEVSGGVAGMAFGGFLKYYISGGKEGMLGFMKWGAIAGIVLDRDNMKLVGELAKTSIGGIYDMWGTIGALVNKPGTALSQESIIDYARTGLTDEQRAAGMKPEHHLVRNISLGGIVQTLVTIASVLGLSSMFLGKVFKKAQERSEKPPESSTIELKKRDKLKKYVEEEKFKDVLNWMVNNGVITKNARSKLKSTYNRDDQKKFLEALKDDKISTVQTESEMRKKFWEKADKHALDTFKVKEQNYFRLKAGRDSLKKTLEENGKLESYKFYLALEEGKEPKCITLTNIRRLKLKKPFAGNVKFAANVSGDPKPRTFIIKEEKGYFYLEGGSTILGAVLKKGSYKVDSLSA